MAVDATVLVALRDSSRDGDHGAARMERERLRLRRDRAAPPFLREEVPNSDDRKSSAMKASSPTDRNARRRREGPAMSAASRRGRGGVRGLSGSSVRRRCAPRSRWGWRRRTTRAPWPTPARRSPTAPSSPASPPFRPSLCRPQGSHRRPRLGRHPLPHRRRARNRDRQEGGALARHPLLQGDRLIVRRTSIDEAPARSLTPQGRGCVRARKVCSANAASSFPPASFPMRCYLDAPHAQPHRASWVRSAQDQQGANGRVAQRRVSLWPGHVGLRADVAGSRARASIGAMSAPR
jgi:hypothetical protein